MTMLDKSVNCRSIFGNTPIVAMAPITMTITTSNSILSRTMTTTSLIFETLSVGGGRVPTQWISNKTTLTAGTMEVEPIVVYWQAKDLTSFGSEYATSLAQALQVQVSASTTPADRATASAATSSTTIQPSPSPSLSPGQLAGIVLGAIFGAAIIALGIFFIYMRHRRYSNGVTSDSSGHRERENDIPEMEDDGQYASRKWFIGGKWRSEVDASTNPTELTSGDPAELGDANHTH